jgi:hypothetical protein
MRMGVIMESNAGSQVVTLSVTAATRANQIPSATLQLPAVTALQQLLLVLLLTLRLLPPKPCHRAA